jgi:outer membrane receptor for ferrienterochelin and colicins
MKKVFSFFAVFLMVVTFCEEDYFLRLDKMLIESSYKIKMEYGELGEDIIIFSEEFLQKNNINTVASLIPFISRMYKSRYRTGETQVFTNGILNCHNERFLLLVNGIPIYDPLYNKSIVDEYFPFENIERIEVAFGGYSSLYGSGTFAGYINIVEKEDFPNNLKVNAGSGGSFKPTISIFGKKNDIEYGITISKLDDDGIGIDKTYKGKPNVLENNPRENLFFRSLFKYKGFFLRVYNINYRFFELKNEICSWNEIIQNRSYGYIYNDIFITAGIDHEIDNTLNGSITLNYQNFDRKGIWGYTVYDSTTSMKPEYEQFTEAKKLSSKIFGELKIDKNFEYTNTLLGFDFDVNNLRDIKDYHYINHSSEPLEPSDYYIDPIVYDNYGVFFQMITRNIKNVRFIGSLRYDHNYFFKGFLSPKFNIGYKINKLSFNFNYSRAFRSPTPRELIMKTDAWSEANPDLEPETINSYKFGMKITPKNLCLKMEFFHQRLEKLIEKIDIGGGNAQYNNMGEEKIYGITGLFEYNNKKLDLAVSSTYQQAKVEDLIQYGYPSLKIVQWMGISILENLNLSLSNMYVGKRPRKEWNEEKEDGKPYITTDVNLTYSGLKIGISTYAKNIFDTSYYTMYYVDKIAKSSYLYDLRMPGRTYGVELNYEF